MEISPFSRPTILDPQDRGQPKDKASAAQTEGTRINPAVNVQYSSPSTKDAAVKDETTLGTLFDTVVDTVNPLQHIPGVSTAYQALTDDTMNPVSAMAGGFLFGGPIGLIAGAASSFLELITGKSLGQNAMALLGGAADKPDAKPTDTIYLASNTGFQESADKGLSLKQYQAFANAANGKHIGTGARAQDVAWSSRTWTTQTLKQAASAYETHQNSEATRQNRANRFL